MKKIFVLFSLLFVFVLLTGCKKDEEVVKIRVPKGAPTFGFIKMIHENEEIMDYKIKFDFVDGTDLLQSAFTSKSHEMVVAPTNFGAKLYTEKQLDYVYAGTVTFGNLYLVSNQEISYDDLVNQTINGFGQGSIPDILLKELLKDKPNLTIDVSTYTALSISEKFISDTNDGTLNISLLAEPSLSKVKQTLENKTVYTVLDLQEAYEAINDSNAYPQAGLFINQDFASKNKAFVDEFLKKLKESADFVNQNTDEASDFYIEEALTPTFPKAVIVSSIPGTNVDFKDSQASKPLIEDFFNLIIAADKSALIGGRLPDDEFYLD